MKDEWKIVKFGEIAREIRLTTQTPIEDGLEFYIGLEHLDPQSLRIQRKGIIAEDNPSFTRAFKAGQILFGKRRSYQKKAAVADFDGICSGDIIVMESVPGKIIPELLPFIVQSDMFFDRAVKTSSGSLSPRTKWKALAEFEFSLPPLERQKEILETLEKMEEAEIISKRLNKSSESLKDSIVKYSIELKNNPLLSLGDVTIHSAFGPRYPSNLYSSSGNIGTIRTTDFSADSRIDYTTIPFANLDEKKFSNHFLKDGDLLITRSGTIGQVDIFKEQEKPIIPGAFQIRFRLNKKVIPEFIRWILLQPIYQKKMRILSNGGVQKNITSKSLFKIMLPIPEIDKQRKVLKAIEYSQNLSNQSLGKGTMLNNMKSKIIYRSFFGR